METLFPKRKANRLQCFDYSGAGYYFITICTRSRQRLLWKPGTVGATFGRPPLSAHGVCVERELMTLSGIYPNVILDKYVIMPNHVHFILRIQTTDGGRPQVAPTVPRIIQQFKGAVTKRIGAPIWQKDFYDHVIRDEADYLRIWSYIDENPAKWAEDCYYTESEG